MNRRTVLIGLGSITSLGIVKKVSRRPPDELQVKIWQTEAAADYPRAAPHAAGYIGHSLEATGLSIDVSIASDPVSLPSKDGQHARRVEWPRTVLSGKLGLVSIDPARDVNLLLTDGAVSGRSAGYGMDNIGAMAGARHLANMPPAKKTPPAVDYGVPAAVVQVLLHECGHALGLDHEHGSITVKGDSITVTPMISGYAWAPASVRDRQLNTETACGDSEIPEGGRDRRLSMRFSRCAVAAIRQYRRGMGRRLGV